MIWEKKSLHSPHQKKNERHIYLQSPDIVFIFSTITGLLFAVPLQEEAIVRPRL